MKGFLKIFLACLSAIIIAGVLLVVCFISVGVSGSKQKVKSNTVLTINTIDLIEDQKREGNFSLSGEVDASNGLFELKDALINAKTDSKIKGVYLKLSGSGNSWATLEELRKALIDFKTSKKFIYAYGDVADQKSLYLATAADSVFINPVGVVEFKGLAINGTFYKNALEKWGVKPEVFYCGKFKGYGEPYRLNEFSPENEMQLKDLLNNFYGNMLKVLGAKSGKDSAYLANLANNLAIQRPQDAAKEKLIDRVANEFEVLNLIKSKVGIKENDKLNTNSLSYYASNVVPTAKSEKDKIVVLYAEGGISDGESDGKEIASTTFINELKKIAKKDDVKAIVLRVNSPGGSALASEKIYQELMQLKKTKPIIISMGGVAASGGYYLSCAGDSVFAEAQTITGSIGVVGILANVEGLMKNKIGLNYDVVKTNDNADFPNLTRSFTELERKYIQTNLDSTYILFKTRVANARRMNMDKVEELAQGHVYSGTKALELGLVDAIGGLDRAISAAAKTAKLSKYSLVYYPDVVDPVTSFINKFQKNKTGEAVLKEALGAEYESYKKVLEFKKSLNSIQAKLMWDIDIK
jgi:protease IV